MALLFCMGAEAGGWSLKDQNGVRYTQTETHGKWVLVNFWAPWCPSCLQEMPDLVGLQQRHPNLQVIGVAVMYGSRQAVNEVVHDKALNYPVVMGNEDIASEFGGMKGMPTSFLYSPDGKLVAKYDGPMDVGMVERRFSAE
jgi:thiol-disulfide isomerase/thioredoxin